jgi:hypothetical protein
MKASGYFASNEWLQRVELKMLTFPVWVYVLKDVRLSLAFRDV